MRETIDVETGGCVDTVMVVTVVPSALSVTVDCAEIVVTQTAGAVNVRWTVGWGTATVTVIACGWTKSEQTWEKKL